MNRLIYPISILIIFWLLGSLIFLSNVSATSDPFPIYKCIEPNVIFWKKVYAQHSSRVGILHDRSDVSIIYQLIQLLDKKSPGAKKINLYRIKKVKGKYRRILERLSRGKPPSSREERRVAELFGPKARRADFRRAQHNIRSQKGLKDRFREGIVRSGAYTGWIKQVFRSYGLPPDLAYLPHVESSFYPNAYSRFGAAGMWQFIRSTGRRFMAVGYVLDERWDPNRSSHAAAQLLKENYKALGSWPMAITAYNHGLAGMLRAKRSKGNYEAIFKEYGSRLFKFASRNFYPEFLAAREVARNYKEYFGYLTLNKPLRVQKVKLEGYASIKDLCQHSRVDIASIRNLNPALRKPVFTGQKYVPKGYDFRLPINAAATKFPPEIYKSRQKRSRFYRVRKGDTASKIARMNQISLPDLVLANHLDSKARIYAGQNLRLPGPGEEIVQLAKARSPRKKKTVISSRSSSEEQTRSKLTHKTTPKAVLSLLPDSHLVRQLSVNPNVVSGNILVERIVAGGGKHIGIIRVEVEETLGHYADWLGIATQEIRRLNGLRYGKAIRINQRIRVPLDKASKEEFEEKRFEYHKKIEEDYFDFYRIQNVKTYQLKNGDNIWALCHELFEVPLWLVRKYNPDLDFNKLQPAQPIFIPVMTEP